LGGHLATITSQEEQDAIARLLSKGTKNFYWLGATDEETESTWKWITGEEFQYSNWDYGQPDNDLGIGDYLQIYRIPNPGVGLSKASCWNDVTVDCIRPGQNDANYFHPQFSGFVCEWDAPLTNETGNSSPSAWAMEEIKNARAKKLIPLHLDGKYQSNITREEFCELAWVLLSQFSNQTLEQSASLPSYSDCSNTHVLAISQLGIVQGYGGNKFGPGDFITREQAAVLLMRTANVFGMNVPNSSPILYADNEAIHSWARDGVSFTSACTVNGSQVMGGIGNQQFGPSGNYTREQAFATFNRLYDCLAANNYIFV